jgi:phospholipid/cholesterol/gamma-HCH transport system substrate-binding protein
MNKLKIRREVRIGIMAIVALFVLYFGLNFLKGIDIFSPVSNYYTSYENIGGLVPSSPVYVKGYKVGQVEEIIYDFQKETSFIVKISVTNDIDLPDDTKIQLYDDGLLGGKAIQLVFKPFTNSSKFFEPGDTIPSEVATGLMAQVAGELMPKIESIASETDSLLKAVRSLVTSGAVQNSMNSIEKITADLSVSSHALKKLTSKDLPLVMKDVNTITADFRIISGNVKQIDFASTMKELDVTIKDLNKITGKINDPKGSVGMLLNDKDLYINLKNTAGSADKLLIDLQQNPKRYVHFSLFGSGKK